MIDLSTLPGYRHILDEIQATWEETKNSRKLRVIVLEGESGADKTGVVETFLATSKAPAIRCRGAEIPESYLPLRKAFESILELNTVQEQLQNPQDPVSSEWQITLTALAQLLPFLSLTPTPTVNLLSHWQSAFAGRATNGITDPDEPPYPVTLPGLFTIALGELAAQTPLAVLMDNLDLADEATIEALTLSILPALKESAVLFIVALEPAKNPKQALLELMQWIENKPFGQRLTLPPLSIAEIETVLCGEMPELAVEQLSSVATHIHRASGGNLARVHDMTRWLKKMNGDILSVIAQAPDHTAVYQEQFAQLSESDREVLQIASVQGATFCSQVIARVCGKSDDEIVALLKRFEQQADLFVTFDTNIILQETTLHWYHFRGRRTREWVYASIPQKKRVVYHQEVGQALEALYGDATVSIAGLLAQQFEHGEVPEKAAHYYAEIARQANEQGAIDQALEYAKCGLSLLVDQDQALQCALLLQQGRALMSSKQSHLAEDVFRQAIEVTREVKIPQLEMESSYYLGELLLNRNIWDEGMELVEQALELAVKQKVWQRVVDGMEKLRSLYSKRQDPQVFLTMCDRISVSIRQYPSPDAKIAVAEILEDKAWLYHEKRKHSETLETLQEAAIGLRSTSTLSHSPEIHYKLHRLRAQSLRACGEYSESLDEAEHALVWAKAGNSRANVARAHGTKADTLRQMGQIAEGEREYEMALALLHTTSDIVTLAEIEGSYGEFLSYSGHKLRAREFYKTSYVHRQEIDYHYGLQMSQNNLAAIDKHLGLFQPALSMYQQLYSGGVAQDDKSRQSLSLNHIGDIYRMVGRLDEAEKAHRQAIRLCEDVDQPGRKTITLRYLGRVYLCSWRLDIARTRLDQAEAMIRDKKVTLNQGLYNRIYMGRLALCEGDLADAPTWLESAIKALDELQDQVWVGIGYLNLGLLMLAEGRSTDALTTTQNALEALQTSESWRTVEAHHLLARCYLATGDWEHAQREIAQAKAGFMELGLSHRVFQAESTELRIQEAQDTGSWEQWQRLGANELRYDFNHLGI